MDKDFLINIAPITNSFLKVSLNVNDLKKLDECVLSLMKATNMAIVRDMFEGNAFRNNFFTRTSAEMAFEKFSRTKIINWERKMKEKDYIPEILVAGCKIQFICSNYGSFPSVPSDIAEDLIFCFYREPKDVLFCGYTKSKRIKKSLKKSGEESLKEMRILGYLTDMSLLKRFNSIEELESLLK